MAYEITNRFDFMRFLSIAPGDSTPDQNTVWDFKEKLGNEGVGQLFELLDLQLAEKGVVGNFICLILYAWIFFFLSLNPESHKA